MALEGGRGAIRTFETGATRDTDVGKNDYEGFLSPLVIERFGDYMTKHRRQSDGKLRDSDNWQKGIPRPQYIKSLFRHFIDLWKAHRGYDVIDVEETLCAIVFNAMGYLHEWLKEKRAKHDQGLERRVDNVKRTFSRSPLCQYHPKPCNACLSMGTGEGCGEKENAEGFRVEPETLRRLHEEIGGA